ncbi:MAG: metalloprotease PmbA [Gammaproteobacteria bacterium]|nr:metalloprotease PmbA [Gammaproteobacteria bacterium]MDH5692056.1 metalloprotease PmbA [Gammaproteobacteria bacterium]
MSAEANMKANKQMDPELMRAVEYALAEAKGAGATAAEASIGMESGLSVTVRNSEVETLEYHQDKGLGITVYFGRRKGSASSSDFSKEAIADTVKAASNIAKFTAEDEYSGLADESRMAWNYPDLDLCHPWAVNSEEAIDLAIATEQAARDRDARIINTDGVSVNSHRGTHVYANSHGFIGGYPTTRHSISCTVIGKESDTMQRDYWFSTSRMASGLESPEFIGQKAADRTVSRLGARKVSTCEVPVIFSNDVSSGLIGHFLRAVRGGALYRKASFLLDSLGQKVFPDWMHMREEPHVLQGIASAPYDSEGVATSANDLVKDGILQHYILDSYAARRLGLESTANAGGVHNLIVQAGPKSLEQLISDMGKGLVVTELMGQGVNGVTGDYSRGAAGFWVENGEIQFPVEEVTVAGNLKDMFLNIAEIAQDVDPRRNIQVGSILLNKMTVAGE